MDLNGRALTGLTGGPDVASVLLYDSVHHGQAQTSRLPERFGSEERLEGTTQRHSIHSCARVGDGEQHVVSRDQIITGAGLGIQLFETDILN